MESLKRTASLEDDLYTPEFAFCDYARKSNSSHMSEILFGSDYQSANYQRFSRIASAQEMEDFGICKMNCYVSLGVIILDFYFAVFLICLNL